MQTAIRGLDLLKVLNDDRYLEPFKMPKDIPEDAKKVYSYTKLCGKNPYLSIIGSFSVGKSSFVNTLSGKEIVPYDTSKTTSVPMLIAKDDDRIIINTFFSQIVNLKIDYLDSIIDQVRHNPDIDYRRYIEFIVLNYKEFPYENTTFADTPGYSGGDKDYEISKSMINISDAVIFLFDASKGSLTDEDLDILEYAKSQKADIFVVANKIDKVWENRQEILDLAIKSLKDRNIDIGRNICYFSNDSDYEKQIKLEFKLIKSFITEVSQKEYFKLAEWNAAYWNRKGLAFFNLSRYSEALQCFDKAIQLEPNNAVYWYNKGGTLDNLSRDNEALQCYDKATQLEPNNAMYWANKGGTLDNLSRDNEALQCYDKAIQLEPNNAMYWFAKGLVLSSLKRYNEALQCYDKATQLESNNAGYWGSKGGALARLERYNEALQCYDKATQLEPNNAVYWFAKGVVLSSLKRYNEALQCYDKATQLEPNNAMYWYNKGGALARLERYNEALQCYDKATQLEPNNAGYWEFKGLILTLLKRYDEAKKCEQKAKELGYNG